MKTSEVAIILLLITVLAIQVYSSFVKERYGQPGSSRPSDAVVMYGHSDEVSENRPTTTFPKTLTYKKTLDETSFTTPYNITSMDTTSPSDNIEALQQELANYSSLYLQYNTQAQLALANDDEESYEHYMDLSNYYNNKSLAIQAEIDQLRQQSY